MARTLLTIATSGHKTHQVFWMDYEGSLSAKDKDNLKNRITDSIDQRFFFDLGPEFLKSMENLGTSVELVFMKPGVTDNPAKSFQELISRDESLKGRHVTVHSGLISLPGMLDFNPLIQMKDTFSSQKDFARMMNIDFTVPLMTEVMVNEYDIRKLSDEALMKLSKENSWALSLIEMQIIQSHYLTLNRAPTDVEIEMIAQTWSEHCKHKIFNAKIDYEDAGQKVQINSLFKDYIKQPTYDLKKPWAISLFDDNAGVVRFRDGIDICIKVETHNSPSALDPYGGALTGILGVNRDIMGTGLGARPVANTDVFCVGMPDEDELPKGLLHPEEILKGIHRGVMDGGNKSGIPTVNGAIYFDESYSGKPLVYCGTVGVLPPDIKGRDACKKGQRPGDLVVMVGGAVGIDGIHGATASSLVMDKTTTLGMVQIGDPFTQKRVMDFLITARDRLLYNSITDNGAGGLSSSVGEMSGATNGAVLNLDKVPLKYPGLQPWQILVSESQERMTLSVPQENWADLEELARIYQVDATVVGKFTDDGKFTCMFHDKTVGEIDLSFLHDGLPKMELKARFEGSFKTWKKNPKSKNIPVGNHRELMNELLSHPTIASKEKWVRQYDHEVQGGTVVKPMEGLYSSAPNDAGVVWYGAHGVEGNDGFAVASGLCPHFSIDDTYLMTQMAIDEAVRNLMCHGVDPDKVALVDNFCWPDPTPGDKNPDAEFKLAQLVRSCMALKEMMGIYSMPLVSGKDSMKNDYHGEKVKISVLPTLLVTALGHVPDVRHLPKSQAKNNQFVYRIGMKSYGKYFGHFLHQLTTLDRDNRDTFNWKAIREIYTTMFTAGQKQLISSIHDISEGGMLVTLFESLMMDKLGISLTIPEGVNEAAWLYSELPGQFVVTIDRNKKEAFESHFGSDVREYLGETDTSGRIRMKGEELSIQEMTKVWRKE
ncbi:MAG: AIR synthase-related protein [Bdellovibrionota bacterium]